jgi:hypothetical protein
MRERVKLTRKQLYDLVWEKPISALASELSISDVGLAKLCHRYDIPTPSRGYWAKVRAGARPKQSPLPPAKEHDDLLLNFVVATKDESRSQLDAAVDFEKREENRVVVADRLAAPFALVRAAKTVLEDAKPDQFGLLCGAPASLDISVSRAELSRALRVADALFKACEERSWDVAINDGKTTVEVNGAPIGVSIEESLSSTELPVKPQLAGTYAFNYDRRGEVIQKPSGYLAISLQEPTHLWRQSVRRNWHESEKRRLEDQLNSVLVGILKMSAAINADIERRQREEREANERKQRVLDAQEEQKRMRLLLAEEKARVELLRAQASRWHESATLRNFAKQARQHGSLPEMGIEGASLIEWCDWALKQADRLDPFVASPPSILDEEDRIEHMCDGLRGYW